MSGKGCNVNTGDLSGQTGVHAAKQPKNRPSGVRAVIVAKKSGNADGAKDGRKRECSLKESPHEKRLSITQEVRTNAARAPRRLNRSDTARVQCCPRPASVWSNKPKGLSLVQQTSARTERETRDWRAVCGKSARTVRREGWPSGYPYPYYWFERRPT